MKHGQRQAKLGKTFRSFLLEENNRKKHWYARRREKKHWKQKKGSAVLISWGNTG